MKIATVVGARPQFIKAAPFSRLVAQTDGVSELLIHTGQHYDDSMSEVFFRELEIPPPSHNLHVGSLSHGVQTGRMLAGIEEILVAERPDLVLLYGDTNSTVAGALAASKLGVKVAHVEAGLRGFDRSVPEEINRVLTDHISDWLFPPSEAAMTHLAREGLAARALLVGDIMFDASLHFAERARATSDVISRLGLEAAEFALATVHRAENTDDEGVLRRIFEGLMLVSVEMPVVLPLHPRTKKALERYGLFDRVQSTLTCIPPAGYLDMLNLEQHCSVVASDSGGVQKEAFFFRKPCLILRRRAPEWAELVELGWNKVVSPDSESAQIAREVLEARGRVGASGPGPYGDGTAAERILEALRS